jgi:nitrate/nitrite transport system ATP-binding protein
MHTSNERFLELSRLSKSFPMAGAADSVVVEDFDLHVAEGDFVCLVGHSGCGKSTVLSIAMGLVSPSSGGVILAGREIDGPGLDRGVVFQSPALLPWFTAGQNVELAIAQARPDASVSEQRRLAGLALARVGLADAAHRRPAELSAGMQQRVGIARAFALEPRVLLLDEPFSLLDVFTRIDLQDELLRLWEADRRTVVMVTHDVDEALLLADRIVLMTKGPRAHIGETVTVPFARPRARADVLDDPRYYPLREHLLAFLAAQEERSEH